MKYKMLVDYYSGVDGSSISEKRCEQIIQIYDMLESLGDSLISYVGIQEEANKRALFGKTKVKSAIRTFFPLLYKLGFVDYKKDLFKANQCFTDTGKEFVLVCKALNNVDNITIHKEEIKNKLVETKQAIQQKGLYNMFNNPEYKEHNMWIALRLLKVFKTITWNEFLFTIYNLKGEGINFEDIVNSIRKNRVNGTTYEFVDEKNKPLPNTCYSYIRSFLLESGLIQELQSGEAKITLSGTLFLKLLSL